MKELTKALDVISKKDVETHLKDDIITKVQERYDKIAPIVIRMGFDDRIPKNFTIIVRYLSRLGLNFAEKGLFITGDTGTGKTMAVKLIAENRKSRRKDAGYVTAQAFANKITEDGAYSAVREFTHDLKCECWVEGRWDMRSYEPVDLIIDDLGSETESVHFGQRTEGMVELIAARYDMWKNCGVRTHVTSNLTTNQIEERYGKRIASRLEEMCYIVRFDGEDQRRRSK